MRVLFVSSGNSKDGLSPIVKNQGESLLRLGLEVHFFTIHGKGFKGYLSNLRHLKIIIKELKPDIVHAHYSMSAFLATLANAKPLVVSLMGSDSKSPYTNKLILKFLNKYFWSRLIVKSEDMKSSLGIKEVSIIPNGVDLQKFYPLDQQECKKKLGWVSSKKQILFAANPSRYEKNYALAEKAFELMSVSNCELKVLSDVPNELMPTYHNAADVILLTSLWEGSPNVIKEAMSCNCTITATDVGDIKWVFGETKGCYLTSFGPQNVADGIAKAYKHRVENLHTNGRSRIIELGLDNVTIAKRVLEVYEKVLKSK